MKDVLQVPENALIVFVRHHTVNTGEQVLRSLWIAVARIHD